MSYFRSWDHKKYLKLISKQRFWQSAHECTDSDLKQIFSKTLCVFLQNKQIKNNIVLYKMFYSIFLYSVDQVFIRIQCSYTIYVSCAFLSLHHLSTDTKAE